LNCSRVFDSRALYRTASDAMIIVLFSLFLLKLFSFGNSKIFVFSVAATSATAALIYLIKILKGYKEDVDSLVLSAYLINAIIWSLAFLVY
jgi:hypothetical protein